MDPRGVFPYPSLWQEGGIRREMAHSVGSVRRRVVPPAGFHGRLPEDLLDAHQFHLEEACTGDSFQTHTSYDTDTGYFTDLLVNDVEESQHPTPPTGPTIHHAPASAKSSQGRSKNFRDEEAILPVLAWLNVGMDPILGVDQSQGTYWRRIHENFHGNKKFESNRTEGSLMNHWSGIQHDVNVFCGCVSKIETRNRSGWSVDDKTANACTLFKAEDKKQRKFAYLHC
ncbi:hypothetical protein PAHAL_9G640600 [Panicum hallii]|uniref:No apical meristem-associated C-terminal domain-containing protein n=1 Tax=Panicum hallii TaxID=206008 RepID=A0A2T8I6U4_9POAL|nr:uncharacterized protein LOC112874938 [Panicum hallii]PVH33385.1 hypothetical protein PAHAL_9G640600 [Panicum hallii]